MEDLPFLDPLLAEQQREIRTLVAKGAKRLKRKTGKKTGRLPCCDGQYRCKFPLAVSDGGPCTKCCGKGYAPEQLTGAFKQHIYARVKKSGGTAKDYAIDGLFESSDGKTKYFGDCAPHCPGGEMCFGAVAGRQPCPAPLSIPVRDEELVSKDAADDVRDSMADRLKRLSQTADPTAKDEVDFESLLCNNGSESTLSGVVGLSDSVQPDTSKASVGAVSNAAVAVAVAVSSSAEQNDVQCVASVSSGDEDFHSPDINGFDWDCHRRDNDGTKVSDIDLAGVELPSMTLDAGGAQESAFAGSVASDMSWLVDPVQHPNRSLSTTPNSQPNLEPEPEPEPEPELDLEPQLVSGRKMHSKQKSSIKKGFFGKPAEIPSSRQHKPKRQGQQTAVLQLHKMFETLIEVAQETFLGTGCAQTTVEQTLHMFAQTASAKMGSTEVKSIQEGFQESLRNADKTIEKRREAAVDDLLRAASSLPRGELEGKWRSYLQTEHDRLLKLSELNAEQDGELTWSRQLENVLRAAILVSNHPRGSEALRKEMAYIAFARVADTRPVNTPGWASAQMNLGMASVQRVNGDRAPQLEEGIRCYDLATKVWTKYDFPIQWANTQRNLGIVYRKRIDGDRGDNLRKAVAHQEAALKMYTEHGCTSDCHHCLNNLSNAKRELANESSQDSVKASEDAVAHAEAALEASPRHQRHVGLLTLAIALGQRKRGDDRERALSSLHEALNLVSREKSPHVWANIQVTLGGTHLEASHYDKAIAALSSAMEVFTKQSDPDNWKKAATGLVRALFSRGPVHVGDEDRLNRLLKELKELDRASPCGDETGSDDMSLTYEQIVAMCKRCGQPPPSEAEFREEMRAREK